MMQASSSPALAGVQAIARAYAGEYAGDDAGREPGSAQSGAARAAAAFQAIDDYTRLSLAHSLCTANRYDAQAMRVVRLYSSNPQAYPPGGSKDKTGTAWGRHVLLDQQVFVGEGEDAIREFFNDHDAIRNLGLQSVINVPVVYGGVCLGTVNFLMPRPAVSDADVHAARLAGLLALPAFQALQSPQ